MIDGNLDIVQALATSLPATDGRDAISGLLAEINSDLSKEAEHILNEPEPSANIPEGDLGIKQAVAVAVTSAAHENASAFVAAALPSGSRGVDNFRRPVRQFLSSNQDAEARETLGGTLRRHEPIDAAAAVFIASLAADNTDFESLRNLTAILRDADAYDAASVLAAHALELHPKDPWAHVQYGNVLGRLGKPKEAVLAYRDALRLDPSLPGVRAALARQATAGGDPATAENAYLKAIEEDPEVRRPIEDYAQLLSDLGRHAESILWHRRALKLRPRSKTLNRRLANALLLREHWQAGRDILSELHGDAKADHWDGHPIEGKKLVLAHQPGDSEIETLFGIGLARALALTGQRVACLCPKALAVAIADPPENLTVIESETQSVTALLGDGDFGAYAPLSALLRLWQPKERPLPAWLDPTGFRHSDQIETFTFISGDAPKDDWPGLKTLRTRVVDSYDIRAVYMEARPTVEKTLAVLKTTDLVITDDPLTAATAAATGRGCIFVLPESCDWWWGDRGLASPWAANQTLIRVGPATTEEDVFRQINDAIAASAYQDPGDPPFHPESGSQHLAEMLDVVGHTFAPNRTEPMTAEALTGGTRNAVFQLHCDDGDRVIRLGRFPPPRDGFYVKEIANMKIAANAGLAPRVDYTNPLDGSMVIEYLDGEIMVSRAIREVENATAIGELFRRLHQLPGFQDRFDIFKKIERNMDRLEEKTPDAFAKEQTYNDLARRLISILKSHRVPHYATHNDPLTRNFILHEGEMQLIDWECSGLGDPHWEVGAMSSQAGLDLDVFEEYLTAYFGSEDHPGRCRIPLYEALCRYFWWTDALKSGLSKPDDPSLIEKAEKWRGWFIETITAENFEPAVKAAETYQWKPSHSPAAAHLRK